MAQRGGKREGAGRPKAIRTIERDRMMDYIAERIAEEGEPIVSALIEKAIKGDVMAIRELFDRGFGKPKQTTELTGKDGKDLFEPSDKIKQLANELITRGNATGNSTGS